MYWPLKRRRVETQQNKRKPLRFSLIIPAVPAPISILKIGFPHLVHPAGEYFPLKGAGASQDFEL